jgi:Gpi18-like mannosyltransferase
MRTERRPESIPNPSARFLRLVRAPQFVDTLVLVLFLVLAVGLRLSLLEFKSLDFYASLKPWYNAIRSQGFAVFGTSFSTYNPPYLYLLYAIIRVFPNLPVEIAVKLPSLIADFMCAFFVALIVRTTVPGTRVLPAAAGGAMLFLPSVVLNSAFWGQADSLYTAGLLACLHFLLVKRGGPAFLCFGIALAFKLQAIFLAPVLLALLTRRQISWRGAAWVPIMLIAAILPAWMAGRPLVELLGIYAYQASQFEQITMNAPSIYAWLPNTNRVFNLLYVPGVIMGASVTFIWFALLHGSRRDLNGRLLILVSLVSLVLVPLFLPKMHERYFYPADTLAVVVACLYPRLFLLPILIGGTSFAAYQPFLFDRNLVPLPLLTLAMVAATAILSIHALKQLYAEPMPPPARADSPGQTGGQLPRDGLS